MRERVVLGLGSNRSWNGISSIDLLRRACRMLSAHMADFSYSSVYRTKPMYVERQDDFLNMAAVGFLDGVEPEELLSAIHEIESSLGRDRSREIRNGPRSIDIDIELFGERHVSSERLEIPHPRMRERAFVLVPMMEILGKDADSKRYEEFFSALESLGTGGVEKILRF